MEIVHIQSQEWVPSSCIVHGVWRETRTEKSIPLMIIEIPLALALGLAGFQPSMDASVRFAEYHYEVTVVDRPDWPRVDACYSELCHGVEDDEESSVQRVLGHTCHPTLAGLKCTTRASQDDISGNGQPATFQVLQEETSVITGSCHDDDYAMRMATRDPSAETPGYTCAEILRLGGCAQATVRSLGAHLETAIGRQLHL